MDLGLGFNLSSISWQLICGGVLSMGGLGLVVLFAGGLKGTKFMRVPDGMEPDEYYRTWKANSLGNKLSRSGWFLLCLAIGLTLGGCGVVILEVVR